MLLLIGGEVVLCPVEIKVVEELKTAVQGSGRGVGRDRCA
jgi:hypothetical protein